MASGATVSVSVAPKRTRVEDVASERVGAEPVLEARRLQQLARVGELAAWPDHRARDGGDDPEDEDHDARHERLAAEELLPKLLAGQVALVRDESQRRVDPGRIVDHAAHASGLLN